MKKLFLIAATASLLGAGCAASTPAPAKPTTEAPPNVKVNTGGSKSNVQVRFFSTIHTTIKDFAFSSKTINAKKGDLVEFTNNDSAPHTVTADGGAFASANLQKGEKFTLDTQKLAEIGRAHV